MIEVVSWPPALSQWVPAEQPYLPASLLAVQGGRLTGSLAVSVIPPRPGKRRPDGRPAGRR